MEEILSIPLKLNFTPNTLGCYGLKPIFHDSYLKSLKVKTPGERLNFGIFPFLERVILESFRFPLIPSVLGGVR